MNVSISEFWASCPAHFVRVLCIQGPSGSGKTTLALRVEDIFRKARSCFFTLHMDDYYKSLPQSVNEEGYDFDNPGALDWGKIFRVIDGIHEEDENLELFEYSFITGNSSGPIFCRNPKPKYFIIEGIYSFFIFSERFFDLAQYDPKKRNEENTEAFIKNAHTYPRFGVFKVLLTTCKEKMLEIRIQRDVVERGKSVQSIQKQVTENVWPATLRRVYSRETPSHFVIDHGTLNEKRTAELIRDLEMHVLNLHSTSTCKKSYICEFCGLKQ